MINRHPISDNPPPERTRIWWGVVRDMIGALWAMLGGPEDMLARGIFTREDRAFFDTMLRGVEALIRRILLIEAAALAPLKAAQILTRRSSKCTRAAHPPEPIDDTKPETWRVAFRIVAAARDISKSKAQEHDPFAMRLALLNAPQTQSGFFDARPLARRFEALLRVFDAPELYAARLAKRIARDKSLLRAFLAIPNLPPWAGADALRDVKPDADHAWDRLALNTS